MARTGTATEPDPTAHRRRNHQERQPSPATRRALVAVGKQYETAEAKLEALRERRTALVIERYQEGATIRDIAEEARMSRPRVDQVLSASGAKG